MGLLSSSVSIIRYKVEGSLKLPVLETIANFLKEYAIIEIDGESSERTVGWSSYDDPFNPDFERSSFVIGNYLVFSLRIDKKTIASKIIKKHYSLEAAKRLAESGRQYLSRNEKKMIKDQVISILNLRIPATPNIYDLIWNYEESYLWFFSSLKSANEELETLFSKSFKCSLIRIFPYTLADLMMNFSDTERDLLSNLSSADFTE